MPQVSKILQSKGNAVWSVKPDTHLYDALKLMAEKEVGALLVLEEGKIKGILSERDYARKVALQGRNSMLTRVSEIMTKEVICVGPDQPLEECMALMTGKHIRHLPVVENHELIGLISIGDVVKEMISGQQFLIDQLESYIRGY